MQSFDTHYFDGKSSSPKNVTLELHDSFVLIVELDLSYDFKDIEVRTKLKNTPQTVSFLDGSYCELKASDFFSLPNDKSSRFILKIESKMKYAFTSFIILAAFIAFSLTYGSTMIANALAPKIPKNIVENISKQALEFLEEEYISESKLDKKSQDFIKKRFNRILNKNSDFKLYFRSSELLGANAFALPNGDIILLDGLIELEKDAEFRGIIGVLAHESGHVVYMHGLRQLIKSSLSSALAGYLMGDFSGFAAIFTTAVIDAKYSRDHENEADSYAIKVMGDNNISMQYMANLFDAMLKKSQEELGNQTVEYSILSSHPNMDERIKKFREDKK
ncbi:MAG: M48 family metallopeptidase [Campylobacteraceae bacterium]|jgi:Zn-dependent protease with chaperone function|nr:M48 family metallopeptidase [Campylobacteraceae bacterium]